jgi:hypothetical protein
MMPSSRYIAAGKISVVVRPGAARHALSGRSWQFAWTDTCVVYLVRSSSGGFFELDAYQYVHGSGTMAR